MKKKKGIQGGQIALHGIFILLMILYLVPFLLVIAVSFTDEKTLVVEGYKLIPSKFSLEAYNMIFADPTQILNSYRTTIIFSLASTALAVVFMGMLAYPMSRSYFRHRNGLSFYVLFTMLFNAGMVPNYILLTKYLHLNNTIWVYILPGVVSAWYVIVIRTNYKALPSELVEAAKLDGASEMRICFQIIMPLSKPVLASVAFLFFVAKWNNWETAMLYITDPKLFSLQYLLQKILNEIEFMRALAASAVIAIPDMSSVPAETFRYAMAVVAAGPVLCIFPFFQKHFTKGLTLGGVKG